MYVELQQLQSTLQTTTRDLEKTNKVSKANYHLLMSSHDNVSFCVYIFWYAVLCVLPGNTKEQESKGKQGMVVRVWDRVTGCDCQVQEYQALLEENESLQRQMQMQEEQFKLQNKTIMDELQKVMALFSLTRI